MITTPRLRLVPGTVTLARSELYAPADFARLLQAVIPQNWPPDSLADALELFLHLLEQNPGWVGWLAWYALTVSDNGSGAPPTLVGCAGFKGPPSPHGDVEMGYSVLPQFQRLGFATEMVEGLLDWAWQSPEVRRVLAQTEPDNLPSQRVLAKAGFQVLGPGTETGYTMFGLEGSPVG